MASVDSFVPRAHKHLELTQLTYNPVWPQGSNWRKMSFNMDIMKRKETDVEKGGWRAGWGMEIQSEVQQCQWSGRVSDTLFLSPQGFLITFQSQNWSAASAVHVCRTVVVLSWEIWAVEKKRRIMRGKKRTKSSGNAQWLSISWPVRFPLTTQLYQVLPHFLYFSAYNYSLYR